MHSLPMRSRRRTSGFTLIELMMVVVIIGILGAIAVPMFGSYLNRSRATEAATVLGEIKQRQEAYRSEFGQYCDIGGGGPSGAYNPASIPAGTTATWDATAASGGWRQLGVNADGPVRFRYAMWAGLPGTTPTAPGVQFNGSDFWFVATAEGDLDGDGLTMTMASYSYSNLVWNSKAVNGGPGWE